MHVALTDVLTCPRCGPEFGLLLVADRVEARRVLEGALACANCRERYPVTAGYADLGGGALESAEPAGTESALRLAALLGVGEGPAVLLVIGRGAPSATGIAALVPAIEVIAAGPSTAEETDHVSRIGVGARLPFRNASIAGVALTDTDSLDLIEEAARVVAGRARVVVESSKADVGERLERCGMRIIAKDESATVAVRVSF